MYTWVTEHWPGKRWPTESVSAVQSSLKISIKHPFAGAMGMVLIMNFIVEVFLHSRFVVFKILNLSVHTSIIA